MPKVMGASGQCGLHMRRPHSSLISSVTLRRPWVCSRNTSSAVTILATDAVRNTVSGATGRFTGSKAAWPAQMHSVRLPPSNRCTHAPTHRLRHSARATASASVAPRGARQAGRCPSTGSASPYNRFFTVPTGMGPSPLHVCWIPFSRGTGPQHIPAASGCTESYADEVQRLSPARPIPSAASRPTASSAKGASSRTGERPALLLAQSPNPRAVSESSAYSQGVPSAAQRAIHRPPQASAGPIARLFPRIARPRRTPAATRHNIRLKYCRYAQAAKIEAVLPKALDNEAPAAVDKQVPARHATRLPGPGGAWPTALQIPRRSTAIR